MPPELDEWVPIGGPAAPKDEWVPFTSKSAVPFADKPATPDKWVPFTSKSQAPSWQSDQQTEPDTPSVPRSFMDRLIAGRIAEEQGLDPTHDPLGRPGPLFMTDPWEEAAGRIQKRYPTRPASPEARAASMGGAASFGQVLGGMIESLKTLPERAIKAAGEIQKTGQVTEANVAPGMETALLTLGTGTKFGRTVRAPEAEASHDQMIGELPRDADFKTSAEILTPERIAAAAVQTKDGSIFSDINHGLASAKAKDAGYEIGSLRDSEGFVTSTGRYVDRKEAKQIAEKQDQIGSRAMEAEGSSDLMAHQIFDENGKPYKEARGADPIVEHNLRRLWEQDGIHPAEAVNDARNDAFLRHDLTTPAAAAPPKPRGDMYAPQNPFELARSGELTADKAQEIAGKLKENQETIENNILGDKETADKWRKLHRQSDRAWDSGYKDKEAREFDRQIAELEEKANLTEQDQAYLDGQGWPEYSDPQAWRDLVRELRDFEGDRSDRVTALGYALRGLPREGAPIGPHDHWTLAKIQHAMSEEAKAGGDAQTLLRDAFHKSAERYGGGADAAEIVQNDMARLKRLMENPPVPQPALPAQMPKEQIERILSGREEGEISLRGLGAEVSQAEQIARMIREGKTPTEIMKEMNLESAGYGDDRKNLTVALSRRGVSTDAIMSILEGKPHPLGAAATGNMPPLVSPAVQPVTPPGRLRQIVKDGSSELLGMTRNLQFMLDPMSTGSPRSMAMAKDTANAMRRADWDWMRIDKDIVDRFDPETRRRMYEASDQESVAKQLGVTPEQQAIAKQGLATLKPAELDVVDLLHAEARETWLNMYELGMVKSEEGLPAWTPRMFINTAAGLAEDGALPLNSIGKNFFTRTAQMRHRKYLTAGESEAAAKYKFGEEAELVRDIRVLPMAIARQQKAIAGRQLIEHIKEVGKSAGEELVGGPDPGRFTIDHPAFKTWQPRFKEVELEDGSVAITVVKDHGNIVFDQVPIHVANEFEGPLRAILDEPASKHPLAQSSLSTYQGLMALKGKTMTVIMNSPLIHNAVVWGKVAPSAPGQWLGFRLYFTGNKIKNNPQRAGELVDRGLAPMGNRGSYQDISSIAEAPNLEPGRSLTSSFLSEMLGHLPQKGLTAEQMMTQIKRDVDAAGDFWHNTLLWDRVADVQFGLADHLSNKLVHLGAERIVADRVASHFANMIVGSIPNEAMSQGAKAFLNTVFFSRSFTFGNLQTFKTAALGLPKPLMAQIARDMGMPIAELSKEMGESSVGGFIDTTLKRRAMGNAAKMAIGIIAVDYAISKIMNSFIQNGVNVVLNDSTIDKELHGYAERLKDEFNNTKMDPFRLMHPLSLVDRMTPMSANEPGKENRIFFGYDRDGTALYAKNPVGKYPEEMMDWLGIGTDPMDVIRRKLSPTVGGAFEVFANDKGFGRKIRDLNVNTYGGHIKNIIAAIDHIVGRHFPQDQIMGAADLLRDQGDQKVNAVKAFGPIFGFTTRQGAPGGMGKGEIYSEQDSYKSRLSIERPAIVKMLKNGNQDGAEKAMDAIGMTERDKVMLKRWVEDPSRISPRQRQHFYERATPEQIERLERTGQ